MNVVLPNGDSIARPDCCCECRHAKMHVHSYYWRIVARVLTVRFRCGACRATVLVVPDVCVRCVHHTRATIAGALKALQGLGPRAVAADRGLSVSTLRRWWSRFHTRFLRV